MKRTPLYVNIWFKTLLTGIGFFQIFRLIQLYIHRVEITGLATETLKTILYGILFDLQVSAYLFSLPLLLLILYTVVKKDYLIKLAYILTLISFISGFAIAASDIPYYNQFYNRLNIQAFSWFQDPSTVFGMITGEIRYWGFLFPFGLLSYMFYRYIKKTFHHHQNTGLQANITFIIPILLIHFLFIRGSVDSKPLHLRDAFKGKNLLLNAQKLNAVLTLEKSWEQKLKQTSHRIILMDKDTARRLMEKYYHTSIVSHKPMLRHITPVDTLIPGKPNIILVLMESMAAWKMKTFGNKENRTPFLDSLFHQGLSFTNLYSNGIHTYAGVFGSLFGLPVYYSQNPLIEFPVRNYKGLPSILKEKGYSTLFFVPGSGSFDNLYAFLSDNDYEEVYTKSNYPKDKIVNIWGVRDRYLFEFALDKIDQKAQSGKPFFATILTISDHGPFSLPDDFYPEENIRIRATRYADASLKYFFDEAQKRNWFEKTIFIFIADHGETHNMIYPTPLTYSHIPLIYYHTKLNPDIIDDFGSQRDMYPTLLGMLGMEYDNYSFGVDLRKTKRRYVLFNADNKYGVIDNEYLYIAEKEQPLGLFRYQTKEYKDIRKKAQDVFQNMDLYYRTHIQYYREYLDNME